MTKQSGRRLQFRITIALAFLLLACAGLGQAAPVVTAGSDTVDVGDTFTIPLSISDAFDLASWQFDLSFDRSILRANAVNEGPFLSESGAELTLFVSGVIDNLSGKITLVSDAFLGLP